VTPGFEAALQSELGAAAGARLPAPAGVMLCDGPAWAAARDLTFARQLLPDAVALSAPSVQRLAEAAYAAVEAQVDAAAGPFTLHAFTAPGDPELHGARAAATARAATARDPRAPRAAPATPAANDAGALASRVELVGRQLLELLRTRRRRAFRHYQPPPAAGPDADASFAPGTLLLQVLALDREQLLVSTARARSLPRGGTDLAPWPAGSAPVALDRAPPSRAYQKLEEAFAWLGAAPTTGQTCVDLGGAPGGWALTALKRGARVTAIDRAPLEPPAAGHPHLTAIIGNAFTFEPPQPVDWLLCDVVCEPARTLALLTRWLDQRWCRALVVTVKFKGRDGYSILADVEPLFARAGWRFARTKQLLHNKNEVTVLARQR
jgi:23S rRNA (cytidine2498-2'-O)-methyltransferase